jgi:hypothetical protein
MNEIETAKTVDKSQIRKETAMQKLKRRLIISMVVVATGLSSGCLWAPELDRVRAEIEEQLPGVYFEKEFAISLGPLSLGLARTIVSLVPPAKEAQLYLRDIRRVKAAVYKAENVPDRPDVQMPKKMRELMEKKGWEIAVKAQENEGESVWIIYRAEQETIKELYLVVLGHDELVLVKAAGNIDRLFVKAIQNAEHHGHGPDEFF